VDGAVDPAAAGERAVGGVHDRVDGERGDVGADDLDHRARGPTGRSASSGVRGL
jgi:hypothetical protein